MPKTRQTAARRSGRNRVEIATLSAGNHLAGGDQLEKTSLLR
jgi:hypothetical protein